MKKVYAKHERIQFGKYNGTVIKDIEAKDPGYYKWMIDNKVITIIGIKRFIAERKERESNEGLTTEQIFIKAIRQSNQIIIKWFADPRPEDFDDGIEYEKKESSFSLKKIDS